ncbi:MAG: hypothetical protein WBR24_01950 [Desulfobacterales bacterium]|jgi:hypothetical protein
MLTDSFIGELRNIVGEFQVSVNRQDTELYSFDAAIGQQRFDWTPVRCYRKE